ncbi:MAG: glutathione S-transferase N-terminal domain-containing protein [Magnetococcales bacterium]|nr:glutathione S-transferase N-terminal domain-containing protein [Magnetococcales bacterium]
MSDKIQLYSMGTPNGQKISIALEEMAIEYDAHLINIMKGDQFKPEFLSINPNSKIPAIVDPTGDNGSPLSIMESGAILLYLAEKSGKLLPTDKVKRSQVLQWLFFQVGGAGPMFGQFGHFYRYAKDSVTDTYALDRYTTETKRLLKVIDNQLQDNKYIAGGEISIADFSLAPWIVCLDHFYKAKELLTLDEYSNCNRWLNEIMARPAVKKGMNILRDF